MNSAVLNIKDVKRDLNPWEIENKKILEEISIFKPMSWLEQDCFTNCD